MSQKSASQAKLVLEWGQRYSVGIEEIDTEHQKFFQLVRILYEAMRINASRTVVGALLGELYAYSASHMTHEEEMLEKIGYPQLELHRQEHREFSKRLLEYMKEFDSGRMPIALSLLQFLQEWLKTHLEEADQQYVDFLHHRAAL